MNKPDAISNAYCLEDRLCQFEKQWQAGSGIDFSEYLPTVNDPEYLAALTEFIRVDMELSFGAGSRRLAGDYFEKFPRMFDDQESKSAIAFEEFRLRNISQDPVQPELIASKYDVSMLDWPDVGFENGVSTSHRSDRATLRLNRGSLPQPGEQFERFRIIGRLGEGAYGTVMLAQQDDLAGRLTVLKFVPAVSEEDSFLARLQHTNIVPVYSIHGNEHYKAICMPFLGVATLQDLNTGLDSDGRNSVSSVGSMALVKTVNRAKEDTIEKGIPSSNDRQIFRHRTRLIAEEESNQTSPDLLSFAADLMAKIADGLGYAHDRGIVHGDLKPANVLIDDDGNPIILDFHLANSKSEGLGSHVGGTLAYMAPEHLSALDNNQRVDRRTDIFSAGVMLYELVTGRLPFELAEDLEQMQKSRLRRDWAAGTELGDSGTDLAAIISKCLSPMPDERYQHGYELAADLRAHQKDLPLIYAKETSWRNRIKKWTRRHPRISSMSTVASVAAIITGALLIWLWSLSGQVRVADAQQKSSQFQKEFSRARLPLTSLVLDDSRHFENATASASKLLNNAGFGESVLQSLPERIGILGAERSARERRAAGELHFWIAEGHLRNIDVEADGKRLQERLDKALKHNELARYLLANQGRGGLKVQKEKIEALQRKEKFEFHPEWSNIDHDDRIDRIAYTFLGRKDYKNALKQLNELVEEDPLDFLAWMQMGQTWFATGEHDLAQACLTLCIGLEPENSYPRLYRAMSILASNRGSIDVAIDDLTRADQLSPNNLAIIQNLGLAYGKARKFDKAKEFYDRAIEMGTSNTRTWYLRSRINRLLGSKEAAKNDMQYFLNTEPSDPISWRTRGTQKIASDPVGAAQDLERAIQLRPNDSVALNNLASLYSSKLDDLPKAIEAMDRVVELNPKNAKFRAGRGVLLARTGERKKAIADATRCIQQNRSAEILYQVAGIYALTSRVEPQDLKAALDFLQRAVKKSPETVVKMMRTDPDIETIKREPEFEDTVEILRNMGFEFNTEK